MESMITVEQAIEIGVKAAMGEISKQKEFKRKQRLRNTELLLKNYNNFSKHCVDAKYSRKQTEKDNDEIDDLLSELQDFERDTRIMSILRTKERTKIMVNHITNMVEFYEHKARKEHDQDKLNRVEVIKKSYFEGKRQEEIAEEMSVSVKTVRRYKQAGIADLSVLIFGIDGLKVEI